MVSGLLTLISLSFYAHYSAPVHILPKSFGTCHLFVILNIQCKFGSILQWEYYYQNSSISVTALALRTYVQRSAITLDGRQLEYQQDVDTITLSDQRRLGLPPRQTL